MKQIKYCNKCNKEMGENDCFKVLDKIREHYDCENPTKNPYEEIEINRAEDEETHDTTNI